MFRLHETGCNIYEPYMDITTCYIFHHVLNSSKLSVGLCNVTVSCNNRIHVPHDIDIKIMFWMKDSYHQDSHKQ